MGNVKIGSNRSFGIVFFVVFLLIGFYPLLNEGNLRIWSVIISIVFFILGLLNSKILTPINKVWFRFGLFLGKIISPLIMGIIFFFVVTPIGIFLRIIKKDIINLKFNSDKSYWIKKSKIKSKMKNQF
tara:strand:+ start:223 stop:606 length:384 start_codon:yes stop_codon:yes gene_type:complete